MEAHIYKNRMIVEQHVSWSLQQGQKYNHAGHKYEILWCVEAPIHGDRCLWDETRGWPLRGKGLYELQARWVSSQQGILYHWIHKQGPIQHRAVVKQQRTRGPSHTAWSGEIPPQLFCQGSKCYHRLQITGNNGQQRYCNPITVATMHIAAYSSIQHAHIIHI